MTDSKRIGVALSGGGHRAGAWALGALLYLADAGLLDQVASIASVSGGSITNGYLAARAAPGERLAEVVARVAPELGKAYAREGTILRHEPLARRLRALMLFAGTAAVALVATVALGVFAQSATMTIALGCAAVAAVLALCVARTRGDVVVDAYAETVTEGKRLRDVESPVAHVFCATDVQFAEHVYMSQRFVYAARLGIARGHEATLAKAVAASAAFPGPFPAQSIPVGAFSFVGTPPSAEKPRTHLVLVDGGVYDNMGEQWFVGMGDRLERGGEAGAPLVDGLREAGAAEVDELWVVNASEAFPDEPMNGARRLLAEFPVLGRVVFALHDNSSSLRRKWLVEQFKANKPRGTLVHIGTKLGPKSKVSDIERGWLDAVGPSGFASYKNAKVRTSLDGIGQETVANLMHHAYVLAAIQGSRHLGYSLPAAALAARTRFDRLARGEADATA